MNSSTAQTIFTVCPADRLPLTVDAIVEEQDTRLILGTEPVICEPRESYPELVRKMERQKPLTQGQIFIKNTVPLRMTAIIYDIERTPVCSDELVASMLDKLLQKSSEYRLATVAMPLLGHTHGGIKISRFVQLLYDTLKNRNAAYPAEILLIAPPDRVDDVRDIILTIIHSSERP